MNLERGKNMEPLLIPSDIKKLSLAERILIVEEIWDSVAAEQELLGVTEAQRNELDRRISSCDASPVQGRSWEEIKHRVKSSK